MALLLYQDSSRRGKVQKLTSSCPKLNKNLRNKVSSIVVDTPGELWVLFSGDNYGGDNGPWGPFDYVAGASYDQSDGWFKNDDVNSARKYTIPKGATISDVKKVIEASLAEDGVNLITPSEISKGWEERENQDSDDSFLKDAAEKYVETFEGTVVEDTANAIEDANKAIEDATKDAVDTVKETAEDIKDAAQETADAAVEVTKEFIDDAVDAAGDAIDDAKDQIDGLGGDLDGLVDLFSGSFGDFFTERFKPFKIALIVGAIIIGSLFLIGIIVLIVMWKNRSQMRNEMLANAQFAQSIQPGLTKEETLALLHDEGFTSNAVEAGAMAATGGQSALLEGAVEGVTGGAQNAD